MMSRIQELEYMEQFHLAKISRLQDNLDNFRAAVETVTINLQADTDVPILDTRSKTKVRHQYTNSIQFIHVCSNIIIQLSHNS